MGRISATDDRAERLQSLTFLGLLADDVTLAALHYPDLNERERRALHELQRLVSGAQDATQLIPRARSMSDPMSMLEEAVEVVRTRVPADVRSGPAELSILIESVLNGSADVLEVEHLQRLANLIGEITLSLTEQVAAEKGTEDWKLRALTFSAA